MRRFYLKRTEDVSGTSGVGVVAEGVEFVSGWVALTWKTELSSLAWYHSIATVEAIHGHDGRTKVIWVDQAHCVPEKPKKATKPEKKE